MSDDVPRYWTPEFVEAFVESINSDEEFQDKAGSFSETIELRCLDTPDAEDVSATYMFEEGRIVDVDLWIDEAPSEQMREEEVDTDAIMARATAPYDVWVQMDKGEMGAAEAIASPDYQIDGSMMQVMSNMGVFRGMMSVAAEVEKTY
jgi:putative sterol carrier protein